MALPNKTSHELIYKPNTKGPWSDTRGPGIGVHGPRSCASAVGIRHSTPTVAPRTVAHGQPFGSPFVAQAPVYLICKEHGPGATDIHLEALLWLKHLCGASIALLIFPLDLCQRRAVTKDTLQCKSHSQSFPQSKVYKHQNRHTNALFHEPLACRAE